MLSSHAVAPRLLELVKELMIEDCLKSFILVGGTALALYHGHRSSIDIDLFTEETFDPSMISSALSERFNFERKSIPMKGTLMGVIDGIKVDMIRHSYPWVEQPHLIEGVRIASIRDLAAMKLNAIVGSGTRLKDFVDLAYLSSRMTLREMMSAFYSKYSQDSITVLRAITYTDDIDFTVKIDLIDAVYNWKAFSKRLEQMATNPDKIFPEMKLATGKK